MILLRRKLASWTGCCRNVWSEDQGEPVGVLFGAGMLPDAGMAGWGGTEIGRW